MTNGEKLKEVFPSIELYEKSHDAIQINFDSVWWNAEYKESTTKNDLEVECVSRKEVEKLVYRFLTKGTDENIAFYEHFLDLSSVTPQEPKIGHWIGTRRVGCEFGEYKEYIVPIKDGIVTDSCHCSECGAWLIGSNEYECYGNYCPNCGARMVESQESEDKE